MMKVFGVEFAPLRVPLERRLQTLAAAAWFNILAFGGFAGTLLLIFLLFTRLRYLAILYAIWIYLDRNVYEKGSRPQLWMKKWKWWYYLKHYFPANLELVPDFKLDAKRNYLFCAFPHGILPAGPYSSIHGYYGDFRKKYPQFTVSVSILNQQFWMPFARELAIGCGCIGASAKSLTHILSKPEGGQITILMPGGVTEAYNSQPGQYKFVIKKRKGFVKLALINGSPLVPIVSFGEPELFEQIQGPKLKKIQEFLRQFIGLAPVIFSGRGFFQYSFGVIPRRKQITTVVGQPIDVIKTAEPTREQVDELHRRFVKELEKLFEEYKHKYVENPEDTHLQLE